MSFLYVQSRKKREIVYSGRYIKFYRQGAWEFAQRNNCSGIVVILALTPENKLLLTEQFRIPVRKNVIEFPAGLVSDGKDRRCESVITAAKRELLEETGYKAKRLVKIMEGPVSGGFTADIITICRAYGLQKAGQGGGDHTESIKVHEVPLVKVNGWLKRMRKAGRLVDPKVYAGLYWLGHQNGKVV